MNRNLIIASALSAVFGVVIGYFVGRKMERDEAEEEIESVKETFAKKDKERNLKKSPDGNFEKKSEPDVTVEEAMEARKRYSGNSYVEEPDEDTKITKGKEVKTTVIDRPYIISEEEYGEFGEYMNIELCCYSDGVITDDRDEILEDIEGTIGHEAATFFNRFDDNAVYVRNDMRKADYEIIRSAKKYYGDVISVRKR